MAKMVQNAMRYYKYFFVLVCFSFFLFSSAESAHAQTGSYSISKEELTRSKTFADLAKNEISAGKYDFVYDSLMSSDGRAISSKKSFVEFMDKISSTLGKEKKSILFNYKKISNDVIRVSYMIEFERGVSVESFFLKMKGNEEISLFRFEITDPSKFSF